MLFTRKYTLLIPVLAAGVFFLVTCTKDKVPIPPPPPEPTLLEKVSGHYKVYDTMGLYLYEMNIVHIHINDNTDSLRFENFDGEFTFTVRQSSPNPNNYPNYVAIGSHNPLYDSNAKRWQLGGGAYTYYNSWKNDTIPLRFQKTNITYWIQDATPYYSCDCKQIAVKQH